MRQLHFKLIGNSACWRKGMVHVRRTSACVAIVLGGLLAGCSDKDMPDEMKDVKEAFGKESGKVTLKLISGASQQERVKSLRKTRTILNKEALTYVATIGNPTFQEANKKWSASAIAIDNAKNRVYITWHSDRQATNEAATWGGALDVCDITDEDHPVMRGMAVSPDMKFNHVLIHGNQLFLSATSNQNAGAVGRLTLSNGDVPANVETIDRIGFPGTSANAVAVYGDNLIAVSGHAKGTYATFAPNVDPRPYYYGKKDSVQPITPLYEPMAEFGGKFVATDEHNEVYVLHNTTGENAEIIKVTGGETIKLDAALKSSDKVGESYDEVTGEWILGNNKSDFYGKHTFVVYGGYAYVACGRNGLRVYDLKTGDTTWTNKTYTVGVCTDGEYLYAVTGAGLRIYRMKKEGKLGLIAFEVENYDEKGTGAPIWTWDQDVEDNKNAAATGTEKRHSPNYVAVNVHEDGSTYIYIAYGQSGVRVYKFTPSDFLVELEPYTGIPLEPEFGL
ncbi:MAG: hypothetical protein K2I90_08355 [Odoribacter sp.]|nr:hypothetical protein [Odoribacter sp.]